MVALFTLTRVHPSCNVAVTSGLKIISLKFATEHLRVQVMDLASHLTLCQALY